ncbi:unnamed protein product [Ixodes pacificus]
MLAPPLIAGAIACISTRIYCICIRHSTAACQMHAPRDETSCRAFRQ